MSLPSNKPNKSSNQSKSDVRVAGTRGCMLFGEQSSCLEHGVALQDLLFCVEGDSVPLRLIDASMTVGVQVRVRNPVQPKFWKWMRKIRGFFDGG